MEILRVVVRVVPDTLYNYDSKSPLQKGQSSIENNSTMVWQIYMEVIFAHLHFVLKNRAIVLVFMSSELKEQYYCFRYSY